MRPDFVEALNNRGNGLMEMKRFEEALASYDEALAIRPDMGWLSTTVAVPSMR